MRMLCTHCWRTARPDVWLPGSDRLELAGWLALGLPGLLYCAWRHAGRRRTCPACGGQALVREARAAARRTGLPLAWGGGRLRSRCSRAWPQALRSPRARLRTGTAGLAGIALLGLGWLGGGAAGPEPLAAAAGPLSVSAAVWLAARRRRGGRISGRCEAFDASGRSLPVEALP